MLRAYRTVSWPTRAAATRSTLLNHTFGSSFSVVRGESKQVAVLFVEWDVLEIVIHQLRHVFGAAMDVGFSFVNVADAENAAGFWHKLHQANRTDAAMGTLVETADARCRGTFAGSDRVGAKQSCNQRCPEFKRKSHRKGELPGQGAFDF